jgi:hypothetical protein
MKAIIGGAVGIAALGGALLLANSRSTSSALQASNPAATVASTSSLAPTGPMYVDCGEGRMALVRPVAPGQPFSQVECAPAPAAVMPQAYGQMANGLVAPAVTTRTVARSQPTYSRTGSNAPVRSTPTSERKQGRSWQKSALIIGGSAAGGAGVGAVLGGTSGAKKGAVVGGIGGLVFDLATRSK